MGRICDASLAFDPLIKYFFFGISEDGNMDACLLCVKCTAHVQCACVCEGERERERESDEWLS
jgi:hypothetical protein